MAPLIRILAILLMLCGPALAQTITNGGTLSFGGTPVDGSHGFPVNCIAGCASGGTTSNASSGVATSSTNGSQVAYNYGFNGTTWDQLQVDGSKNLKVVIGANSSVNLAQVAGTTTDTNSGNKSAGTLRVVLATDQPALTNKLLVTPDSVALPANQSVNVAQINGVTTLMGNGTTGTGSQRVTIASDNTAFAVNAAATATEVHAAEVGSNQIKVQVAQTVTAAGYTAGNAVGGLMTIANAARVSGSLGASGTGGILQNVAMNSKSAQTTQVDVFVFDANPSGSTCTDKTAFVLASADFDKVIGVAHITDWTAGNTASLGQAANLAMAFDLSSATSIFACAVTRATPTYASTSDISFKYEILRD